MLGFHEAIVVLAGRVVNVDVYVRCTEVKVTVRAPGLRRPRDRRALTTIRERAEPPLKRTLVWGPK